MSKQPGYDPYAIPESPLEDPWGGQGASPRPFLAPRMTRFWARALDGALMAAAALPGFLLMLFAISRAPQGQPRTEFVVGALGVICLLELALFGVNCYYLHESGQTLGKKALGIKIVAVDGRPASVWRILGLRMFVMGLIEIFPFGIGSLASLVNALMIFSGDQRCGHDHLAGTIVVSA